MHAEQINEMRQLLLSMFRSNETRKTHNTADFELKLAGAASVQYAEHSCMVQH